MGRWKYTCDLCHDFHCTYSSYNELSTNHETGWRTRPQETKANPTIRIPINSINWGLPKSERLKLCAMPIGDKSQGVKAKRDGAEYLTRQRNSHSSLRRITTVTWRRRVVNMY